MQNYIFTVLDADDIASSSDFIHGKILIQNRGDKICHQYGTYQ